MLAETATVDFAVDHLQVLLHRVDEHLADAEDALTLTLTAVLGVQEVRRELENLHSDLVFGPLGGDDAG